MCLLHVVEEKIIYDFLLNILNTIRFKPSRERLGFLSHLPLLSSSISFCVCATFLSMATFV